MKANMLKYCKLYYFLCIFAFSRQISSFIITNSKISLHRSKFAMNPLHLFNLFNKKDEKASKTTTASSTASPVAGKAVGSKQIDDMKTKLEKISNKQQRDYAKEASQRKVEPPRIADKQSTCYNFNKADEFPNLYKGWLKSEGDQIGKQIASAARKAIQANEKYIEVLFDPVPNLDEVAVGSAWNQKFRLELASALQVPDYATNRGGPATLEWSTLYWANRLAQDLSKVKPNIVALSISGQGIPMGAKSVKPVLHPSLTLLTFSEGIRPTGALATKQIKCDLLIVLSPCQPNHYNDARKLADNLNVPVIALNAPYSYIYDVGKLSRP
jgi:hypothetical protein